MDSTQRRAAMAERPDYLRSRVTNGRDLLPNVDGRSLWIRRLRDVMSAHIADLGGDDAISEAERSIVRRVGTLTVAIEQIEARFAQEGKRPSGRWTCISAWRATCVDCLSHWA